jgi:hypothetical protein
MAGNVPSGLAKVCPAIAWQNSRNKLFRPVILLAHETRPPGVLEDSQSISKSATKPKSCLLLEQEIVFPTQ